MSRRLAHSCIDMKAYVTSVLVRTIGLVATPTPTCLFVIPSCIVDQERSKIATGQLKPEELPLSL